jgi:hypothetical protein
MILEQERDYQEAIRRIKEAEKTGAVKLDLRLPHLTGIPPELKRLASLQSLNLSWCRQLSDLAPLASLASLQELNLEECRQRFQRSGKPHLPPITRPHLV